MANLKAATSDNPKVIDKNGRPVYAPAPDLQPRLDEKREALNAKLADMDAQAEASRKDFPPAPGVKVTSDKA